MKKSRTIISFMILLAAFACTKNTAEESGQVTFSLSGDYEIADKTKSNVSQFTSLPSSDDFEVSIRNSSSSDVWSGKISEWASNTQLKAGNYSVTATYGSLEEEGFDKPFFTGSSEFAVTGGNTSDVHINVSLGNTLVLVRCTDNFKKYYKDYTFTLKRDGADIVTFVKDETKAAFIDGYKFTLEGTLVSETKTQSFSKEYTSLDEATAYTILFDASNVGGAAITVTFNDTVETVVLGDIELND